MSIVRWEMPREGLAVSSDCDAVWRSDGTASPISLCCLWPDRGAGRQLALTLPVDAGASTLSRSYCGVQPLQLNAGVGRSELPVRFGVVLVEGFLVGNSAAEL